MNQPASNPPIFLLGTGRCGSTYLQRLLCSTKGVWIWGEHEGLLTHLSNIFKLLNPGSPLSKWNFDRSDKHGVVDLESLGEGDATSLAWASGFDRENLKRAIANFTYQLFTSNLPEGKDRWGFKEIRYGPESRVAEMLMEIFPKSKIVITARKGNDSVMSALASWHYDAVLEYLENDSDAPLVNCVKSQIERWLNYCSYFADLAEAFPNRVVVSRLETPNALGAVFEFLELDFTPELQKISKEKVNTNKKTKTLFDNPKLMEKLSALLEPYQIRIHDIESRLGY